MGQQPEALQARGSNEQASEKRLSGFSERLDAAGPPQAEELISSCYSRVFGLSWRLSYGDREAAMELVQESFYRAIRSLGSFNGQSELSTWMYRIVINTWSSAQRRRRIRDSLLAPVRRIRKNEPQAEATLEDCPSRDKTLDPAEACSGRHFQTAVQGALRELPQKQQLVFTLKVQQEMSIPEIAEVTGLAEGTIKSHLFRATRRLRDSLKDWVDL